MRDLIEELGRISTQYDSPGMIGHTATRAIKEIAALKTERDQLLLKVATLKEECRGRADNEDRLREALEGDANQKALDIMTGIVAARTAALQEIAAKAREFGAVWCEGIARRALDTAR